MSKRAYLAAAVLIASWAPAFAQDNAGVASDVAAPPADPEPPADENEIVVTAEEPVIEIPVPKGVQTLEMRQQARGQRRCALMTQDSADAMRPQLDRPEDACR